MAHDADRQSSWLCPRCRSPLRPTVDKFSCSACIGIWTADELALHAGGKRRFVQRKPEHIRPAIPRSAQKAVGCEGVAVLCLALGLHVIAGIAAVVVDWWQLDDGPFFEQRRPHPLDRWEIPAAVVWCVVGVVILLLTDTSIRRRYAVQLLLPVVALGGWLAAFGLVGPYPVTLRGEVGDRGLTTTMTVLEPGWQTLVLRNTTADLQHVGVVFSDEPIVPAALKHGTDPDRISTDAVAWFWLEPMRCGAVSCSLPTPDIEPGGEIRHAVMLRPGNYALVCARLNPLVSIGSVEIEHSVIDGWCQPVVFTVTVTGAPIGIDSN